MKQYLINGLQNSLCWVTGGGGGGTHSKINYKALNGTPNARSQQFFENQLSMRSHTKSVCSIQ